MKRFLATCMVCMLFFSAAFAQVQEPGFSNTVLTGFGTGDNIMFNTGISNDKDANAQFYGFTDYFTGNYTVGKLTFAGDIAWNINFVKGLKATIPYWNTNVVINPIGGLDVGVGTNLGWQVGPGPSYGPIFTAYSTPYYAGLDFNPFSRYNPFGAQIVRNFYAYKSFGIRYRYEKLFEVGFALNDGATSDNFDAGLGAKVNIKDLFSLGFAYNGPFKTGYNNLYLGSSITAVKGFVIDVWWNFKPDTASNRKDSANTLGARVDFDVGGFKFKPEFSTTFWGSDYKHSPSLCIGLDTYMSATKEILVGLNTSLGIGSDYTESDAVKSGLRLNINPYVVWNINKANRLSVGGHLNPVWWRTEDKFAFQWSIPIAWRYKF